MELISINADNAPKAAPLVADFRVTLDSYKGRVSRPDAEAGKEELLYFLDRGWPVFAAAENGEYAGYIVCRIDDGCVWVEHIYVKPGYRRRGAASLLFRKAEEIAVSLGGDTLFNFVHPNNLGMIEFLRTKGYTVLNLIEIRKPFKGERPATTVRVNGVDFDY
ncbi:MAG: GNAT family N-acetyltransferase [Clostridiales bacterium]|nr:GNAT family N-acetyltransferase [Clostridiales bacterium]